MTYPTPHYAASIWISGDKLMLAMPSTVPGSDKGHTAVLPATADGLSVVMSILKERSREGYRPTIGTKAAPPQYDIDAILRSMKKTTVPPSAKELRREAPATLTIEDLDL